MNRGIRNALVALMVIFPAAFITASYLENLVETNGQEGSTQLVAVITRLPTTAIKLAAGAGYGGIFLLMLLESASFPVQSEVILPLAGYLV